MTLLLDTSILIDLEKRDKRILEKIEELSMADPAKASITFINYFEFFDGLRLKSQENRRKSIMFIDKFHFLEPGKTTAQILSDLRHKYEKKGKSFSLSDLIIASQAIENNMTLVTGDKSFEHIEELKKAIL